MEVIFYQIRLISARVSGRWVGRDSPSKRENLKPQKNSKNAPRTHLSTAPWNDGGRSFCTKECRGVYTKNVQKGVVFQEKGAFSPFSRSRSENALLGSYDIYHGETFRFVELG